MGYYNWILLYIERSTKHAIDKMPFIGHLFYVGFSIPKFRILEALIDPYDYRVILGISQDIWYGLYNIYINAKYLKTYD